MATGTATQRISGYSINGYYIWIGILWLVVLQGLYSFVRQTVDGHALTGLGDVTPWGLYIAGFVFFVGATVGSTLIGLLIHAFGREDYAPLGTRAILVGLVALGASLLFIMVDIGSIPRMVQSPWMWRNPTSMFMYTSLSYYVFGLMLLAQLYYTVRVTRGLATGTDRRIARWLSIAALPVALVVLQAPDGALFAVVVARDFWNSPLVPPHFAVAGMVTGTAVMLLLAIVTSAFSGKALVRQETLLHMGLLLAFFIGVAALLEFSEVLVTAYSDSHASAEAWGILTGAQLPVSLVHVLGLVIAFAVLLLRAERPTARLTVGAAVALIAVAAYRYNLTTVGVAVPLYGFMDAARYAPTWIEISLTAGIVALGLLAYSMLARALPMEQAAAPEAEAPTQP